MYQYHPIAPPLPVYEEYPEVSAGPDGVPPRPVPEDGKKTLVQKIMDKFKN